MGKRRGKRSHKRKSTQPLEDGKQPAVAATHKRSLDELEADLVRFQAIAEGHERRASGLERRIEQGEDVQAKREVELYKANEARKRVEGLDQAIQKVKKELGTD